MRVWWGIILVLIGCQRMPTREEIREEQDRKELIEEMDSGGCREERAKCILYSSKEFRQYCEISFKRCLSEDRE